MKVIAFDVGSKYTGFAVSDRTGTIPSESGIIESNLNEVANSIFKKVKEVGAQAVVIGVPKTLKGKDSIQTKSVLSIIKMLREMLDIPVYEIDERLTTIEATRILRDANVKRNRKKLNEVAAKLILETFLEMQGKVSDES
ncbi:MAG: Holliday junction resolvase RuvX [Actinobacteria bacterium]|nr:Holliday junction resolvase RuvX [Actinomycetota bacterium]